MSNIKKYLITVLVSVSCILMMTTNVSAWTKNCNTIEQQVAEVYEEMWSSTGACTLLYEYGLINYASECISLQTQYNEMIEWADTYCNVSCETNLNITRWNWQYKVDGINQYIFRITDWNGEVLFCIDPTMTIDTCTDYTSSTIRLSNETYQKIAIAIKRYSESPTTNHYIATQLYIWEVMGYDRTVSGNDWSYYWSTLGSTVESRYASVQGGASSYNEVVNALENDELAFSKSHHQYFSTD